MFRLGTSTTLYLNCDVLETTVIISPTLSCFDGFAGFHSPKCNPFLKPRLQPFFFYYA
ncbi:MAG: hypothetical protein L6V95_02370 [Candidatus Melainabacteria bacterium]|nr:MAG: hypothetical protein L6V95_02370 [Candidatus Melainabacteria bacterium]